jgi:DNA-binding HxlR family transcriptional regulator
MQSQKETGVGHAAHGRWYDDACGAAFAMELIGERWSLPVIRELMLGGRRFSDIRASIPGISAKMLTERLERLEAIGVVRRMAVTVPAPAKLYALTDWGRALEPVMAELGRWSVQSPGHNPQLPLTPVSLMLSLRAMFVPAAAGDWRATVRFEVGPDLFLGQLDEGELHIRRHGDEEVPVLLAFRAATANAYLGPFYGKYPLDAPGVALDVVGERADAERFIGLFRLLDKRVLPA